MWAAGIGDHPRLVFKWNSRRRFVGDDGDRLRLPDLSAIKRAPDKDAVARCSLGPIVCCAELVKGDIAEESVACGIVGDRDIARNTILLRCSSLRYFPGLPAILRIRHAGAHLPGCYELARIFRINGNCRFVKEAGFGSYISQVRLGRGRKLLSEQAERAESKKKGRNLHRCVLKAESF